MPWWQIFGKRPAPEPGDDGWITAYRWHSVEPMKVRMTSITSRQAASYSAVMAGYAMTISINGTTAYVKPDDVPPAWR
jgi:hypothetical protein